jgi:flagellar hook-associated protein FlgK
MSSMGINIGLKSLLTAQAHLETIGHNVSNASTPGYSRQALQTSASSPLILRGLLQGTGVQGDVINRTVDTLLQARIASQVSSLGRIDARLETYTNIESFLGGASDSGAPALLKKMFQSFSSLSTAPEDSVLRTGAIQSSVNFVAQVNSLAGRTQDLERNVFLRLESNIEQVNLLATRIGSLNQQIASGEVGTLTANDLRDARDQTIKELSQYVDVRSVEDARGAVRVLVGGRILVSPTTVESMQLSGDPATGDVQLEISGEIVQPSGGALAGLIGMLNEQLPAFRGQVDKLANSLILEANRVHSTGVPASGSFRTLVSANPLQDRDQDGDVSDELLSQAGLPFEVTAGELYVNVVDEATGGLSKHKIPIDPTRTTAAQLVSELNAVGNLSASIDAQGRLQIVADAGYRFDFSPRLDGAPDKIGSFGGGRATLSTATGGPFALAVGDTLDFNGPQGAFSVSFASTSFAQIDSATASEVAAALNADASFSSSGLVASDVGGALVLQTVGTGSTESFQLVGGTAANAFGWTAGTTLTGQDSAVAPRISGIYTGASNGELVFRPNMDGVIGTTQGLRIEVFDAGGAKLTEIDVGPGYTPGDEIDVLNGVKASFGFGSVSASNNDVFRLDVAADSDTSDVLVALGLNTLFVGSTAADIAVRGDIVRDNTLLSASLSGEAGDGSALLQLLQVESRGLGELGGASLDEFLADIVSEVALEIDSANGARDSEQFLLDGLETRRDQVSGVNTDEELVRMIEQEQAYNMAAQYLRVVNDLMTELMNIL